MRRSNNTIKELEVFLQANADMDMYSQYGNFTATDVIVVTWDGVPPWPSLDCNEEVSLIVYVHIFTLAVIWLFASCFYI